MFRNLSFVATSLLSFTLFAGPAAAASAWPASTTGTNIGGGLGSCPWLDGSTSTTPPGFEPSGIVWDDFTGALWLVGDEGQIARMLRDGGSPSCWSLKSGSDPNSAPPDLESIAVTGDVNKIYLGVEYPPQILEYTSSSTAAPSSSSNRNWLLPGMTATATNGMEGMTWVPNGQHPYPDSSSGGLFFASSQSDGTIYVYDVNLAVNGSTPVLLDTFTPDSTQTDISDLYYSPQTRTLFVLYDTANLLREIDTSTTQFQTIHVYNLPTSTTTDEEGVTLLPQCPGATTKIYLADDGTAHNVFSFTGYPQLCSTVLAPTADATTHQSSPTQNSGTTSTLIADAASQADRDFLIRFNLSSVTLSQISRADLLFYVGDGTNLSPQFCPTSASWSETGVNWSNQPSCQQTNQGGGASVADGSWVSYDVASLLRSGFTSFRFSPRSSNDFIANSRQATSNPPQLVLWLTGQ